MQINTTFGWMRKAKQPFQLNLVNYVQNSRVDVELKKLLPIEATWRVRQPSLATLTHSLCAGTERAHRSAREGLSHR